MTTPMRRQDGSRAWMRRRDNCAGTVACAVELLEARNLLASMAFAGAAESMLVDHLRVTEVNYHPLDPSPDEIAAGFAEADQFEYLELRNLSQQDLDLNGVQVVGGISATIADVTLAAQEHLLIAKDPAAFRFRYGEDSRIAGPFDGVLSNSGEALRLVDAAMEEIQSFTYDDKGLWPIGPDGNGATLEVIDPEGDYNDAANWRSSAEYFGSPGSAGRSIDRPIVINELLANPAESQDDFIELYNPGTEPADISGWYLSDAAAEPRKFRIPDGTSIAAGSFLMFGSADFNPGNGSNPGDFQLSANGEAVGLYSVDLTDEIDLIVDYVQFGGTVRGTALGRWPNGTGDLFPMSQQSPDAANAGPVSPEVLISEIRYNSGEPGGLDDLEFIELFNRSGATIDLSGWQLDGGIEFVFPAATSLLANAAIVVVPFDPLLVDGDNQPVGAERAARFRAHYGLSESVQLLGGYSGGLSNGRDFVELRRSAVATDDDPDFTPNRLDDRVVYSDALPWPAAADGRGDSLKRVGADSFGNFAASWRASVPTPGTYREDPATFQVLEIRPHDSGFVLEFDRQLDTAALNLFRSFQNGQAEDFVLSGESTGPLAGSVFWDAEQRRLEWIKTGAPLAPGNYTFALAGRIDGIRTTTGDALDGDDDNLPGGDFTGQFQVPTRDVRNISISDFSGSSSQSINVRASGGIPVRIDEAQGVVEIDLKIHFDPALLNVSDAIFSSDFPLGWEIDQLDLSQPGLIDIGLSGPTALPAGPRDLLVLSASVPANAQTGDGQILWFDQAELNDGAIPARGDMAVQVVALPGDASGSGVYSSFDAALLARVAAGLDSGFAAFPHFDPVLIGAVLTGDSIQLADALAVARLSIGLDAIPLIAPSSLAGSDSPDSFQALIGPNSFATETTPASFLMPDDEGSNVSATVPSVTLKKDEYLNAWEQLPRGETRAEPTASVSESTDHQKERESKLDASLADEFVVFFDSVPGDN